jgi:hypothetical protein
VFAPVSVIEITSRLAAAPATSTALPLLVKAQFAEQPISPSSAAVIAEFVPLLSQVTVFTSPSLSLRSKDQTSAVVGSKFNAGSVLVFQLISVEKCMT